MVIFSLLYAIGFVKAMAAFIACAAACGKAARAVCLDVTGKTTVSRFHFSTLNFPLYLPTNILKRVYPLFYTGK